MTRSLRLDDLYSIEIPESPALAPDTRRVAYVLSRVDPATDRPVRSLWMACTDGRAAQPLTDGPDDAAPAWSPDGTHLAFVRRGADGAQLCLLAVDSGTLTPLVTMPAGIGRPSWSPDGRRIAFTAAVALGGDDASADPHRPMVTDRLGYHGDGSPWRRDIRHHLHLLAPFAPGTPADGIRQITGGDWDVSSPAWSPDGTRLAFTADPDPDADLTRTRSVHVVGVDSVAEPVTDTMPLRVGPADGHLGTVGWIDDQTLLAGGRIDTHTGHDYLYRLDIETGRAENLTAGLDRSIMRGSAVGYPGAAPQLVDDGRTILFCARDRGCTHLFSVPVAGGAPQLVLGGAGRVVSGMSAVGGRLALVLSTPRSFGEIVLTDTTGRHDYACTAHGTAVADVHLRPRVEREFAISDGTVVHGWLLRDPAATGPQPLLLDIHGGPHNAWNGSADPVHLYHQVLADLGWTILILNPRASDGYGEAFYRATVGAWGKADIRDFLEPLDRLVAEGVADPDRLAVTGYSYGGFMTCYLTAHDDRFAAAVTGGPVVDLVSDAGTCDEGPYLSQAEIGAAWWSDPEPFRELSPLSQVARVHTPTLILQGDDDARCPKGQAQQWFTALRERRVPTRLVLYPGASHGFVFSGRASHRIDFNQRVIDWVQRYANATG
jgi:dipeptidyl aminopeptidase/acylaminoacyl peptidase